jgi:hypothetical protein
MGGLSNSYNDLGYESTRQCAAPAFPEMSWLMGRMRLAVIVGRMLISGESGSGEEHRRSTALKGVPEMSESATARRDAA